MCVSKITAARPSDSETSSTNGLRLPLWSPFSLRAIACDRGGFSQKLIQEFRSVRHSIAPSSSDRMLKDDQDLRETTTNWMAE